MTTFDQMNQCTRVDRASFQQRIMGLAHIFYSEVPTEGGRVLIVRDGVDGPLVGFRDDCLGHSAFYLR